MGRGHWPKLQYLPHPLGRPLALSSNQATLRETGRQTNPILIEEEETMASLFAAYREGLTGWEKCRLGEVWSGADGCKRIN